MKEAGSETLRSWLIGGIGGGNVASEPRREPDATESGAGRGTEKSITGGKVEIECERWRMGLTLMRLWSIGEMIGEAGEIGESSIDVLIELFADFNDLKDLSSGNTVTMGGAHWPSLRRPVTLAATLAARGLSGSNVAKLSCRDFLAALTEDGMSAPMTVIGVVCVLT